MDERVEGANGHVAVNVINGVAVWGNNNILTHQSAPLYVISGDEGEILTPRSTECLPSSQQELSGTGKTLDAEKLRNVVVKNSVATYRETHHPLAHIIRHIRLPRSLSRKRVDNVPDTPEEERRGNVRKRALLLAMRKDKKVVIIPVVLLILCMGLGLWGIFAASAQERRQRLANAQNRAADKAQTIASELRACYLPVKVMQSFVTRFPYFPTLNATFASLATELLSLTAAGSIANMQLAPMGVVMSIEPLQGNEAALNYDLLADHKNRRMALLAISSGNLTLAGPYMLVQGFMGAPARFPIFVRDVDANETFGTGHQPTNCSECYDPKTRTKFWGFATVLIHWDRFLYDVVRIEDLNLQGLQYRLTRQDDLDRNVLVKLSGREEALRDAVEVNIIVPNNVWSLGVEDSRGWSPNWKFPLVAMVVVMSLVLALLVGMALAGRAQQHMLLEEVLSANQQLEEAATALLSEKERMEALLRRQYNLIECLELDQANSVVGTGTGTGGSSAAGGQSAATANGNGGVGAAGGDTFHCEDEGHTSPADKIEEMRKRLLTGNRMSTTGKISTRLRVGATGGDGGGHHSTSVSNVYSPDLDLVLGDMIGEGTFGKVYKGLWRGTEVAVKSMVLPANMSGKEKREKMAVMEAAISSYLAHPNVVATYTYQIKPIKDSSSSPSPDNHRPSDDLTASAIIVGPNEKATIEGGASGYQPKLEDPLALYKEDINEAAAKGARGRGGGGGRGTSHANIHSYEVQLVLEYCDKGCLREALDAGIFFGQTGLNYPAILDTAADVAKALLHLHLNDVLHGDLKADNVMLKSCGGEGRGIMAKVADFGLAIKMDHMKTHVSATFQGTLTHMAPEVLLHGQVSRAADVYAFGVTLWEMFTGGQPYPGVPGALLGHLVSKDGKRPVFPPGTPTGFRELAVKCWHPDAVERPGFEEILATLTALRAAQPPLTLALSYNAMTPDQRRIAKKRERDGLAASLRRLLAEEKTRQSVSAPLPRLHHHYGAGRNASGSGMESTKEDAGGDQLSSTQQRTIYVTGEGSHSRSHLHTPRCGTTGRRGSRSRSKADEPMIVVGGRNVSLANAITSKSVVLEPICETRFEGDPDAPALEALIF